MSNEAKSTSPSDEFQESSEEIDYNADKRFQLPEQHYIDMHNIRKSENGLLYTVKPIEFGGLKTYLIKNGRSNDKVFVLVNSQFDGEEIYDTLNYGSRYNPDLFDAIYSDEPVRMDDDEKYTLIINGCIDLSGNDYGTVLVNGWYDEETEERIEFKPNITKVIVKSVIMPINTNLLIDQVQNVIIKAMFIGGVKIPTC